MSLTRVSTVQCPREGCDNSQAAFYQVQIRSADEPMTTFYKVRTSGAIQMAVEYGGFCCG